MAKYNELLVWQKSMDLVESVYLLLKELPQDEKFALSDQMRRAVVSIPSNIAEGSSRNSNKDFIRFLNIASGSNAELRTQLEIAQRVGYLTKDDIKPVVLLSNEIGKMLRGLMDSLDKMTSN